LTDVPWSRIGHANDVRAMTGVAGSLYCATSDGTLWRRDPVLSEVNWERVGTMPADFRGLAATSQGLFAATSDHQLLMRNLP
jgi:hypothetical protein